MMGGITIAQYVTKIPTVEKRPYVRPDICKDGCTGNVARKGKEIEFVRCCLCTKWYHADCLNLPENELAGVWSCMRCRFIADEVAEIRQTNLILMEQNNQILDIMREQRDQIQKFVSMQTQTSGFLKDIEGNVKDIHQNVCEEPESDDEYEEPEGIMVYGDSLIRDCESTDSDLTFERTGPLITNMRKTIKKDSMCHRNK